VLNGCLALDPRAYDKGVQMLAQHGFDGRFMGLVNPDELCHGAPDAL
jgi:hypothetical protein